MFDLDAETLIRQSLRAPEFAAGLARINAARPLTLADLRRQPAGCRRPRQQRAVDAGVVRGGRWPVVHWPPVGGGGKRRPDTTHLTSDF